MRPRFESGQGYPGGPGDADLLSARELRCATRVTGGTGGRPPLRSVGMEATITSQPPRRRRRSPEEAEREIITAAESLLRERPFRELTVDEVMRRTGLSRPSFYVYFRDRHHLVLRVVEHIGGELFTMSERWFRGAEPGPEAIRAALQGIVHVYELHGPVMRALADAAADDPDVERVYGDLVEGFVLATRSEEHTSELQSRQYLVCRLL